MIHREEIQEEDLHNHRVNEIITELVNDFRKIKDNTNQEISILFPT